MIIGPYRRTLSTTFLKKTMAMAPEDTSPTPKPRRMSAKAQNILGNLPPEIALISQLKPETLDALKNPRFNIDNLQKAFTDELKNPPAPIDTLLLCLAVVVGNQPLTDALLKKGVSQYSTQTDFSPVDLAAKNAKKFPEIWELFRHHQRQVSFSQKPDEDPSNSTPRPRRLSSFNLLKRLTQSPSDEGSDTTLSLSPSTSNGSSRRSNHSMHSVPSK
jgi:hypothetical protein